MRAEPRRPPERPSPKAGNAAVGRRFFWGRTSTESHAGRQKNARRTTVRRASPPSTPSSEGRWHAQSLTGRRRSRHPHSIRLSLMAPPGLDEACSPACFTRHSPIVEPPPASGSPPAWGGVVLRKTPNGRSSSPPDKPMRVLLLASSFVPATAGAGAVSDQSSAAPTSDATPRVSSSGVRIVPRAQ